MPRDLDFEDSGLSMYSRLWGAASMLKGMTKDKSDLTGRSVVEV
jgi:hypothetical protein